jgi:hypothetical protein
MTSRLTWSVLLRLCLRVMMGHVEAGAMSGKAPVYQAEPAGIINAASALAVFLSMTRD